MKIKMRAKTGDSNRKGVEIQVEKLSQSRRKRPRDGNREETSYRWISILWTLNDSNSKKEEQRNLREGTYLRNNTKIFSELNNVFPDLKRFPRTQQNDF